VVADGTVAGILGISDPIKQSTPAAIKALHQLGLKVIMATGDNRKTKLRKPLAGNSVLTKFAQSLIRKTKTKLSKSFADRDLW